MGTRAAGQQHGITVTLSPHSGACWPRKAGARLGMPPKRSSVPGPSRALGAEASKGHGRPSALRAGVRPRAALSGSSAAPLRLSPRPLGGAVTAGFLSLGQALSGEASQAGPRPHLPLLCLIPLVRPAGLRPLPQGVGAQLSDSGAGPPPTKSPAVFCMSLCPERQGECRGRRSSQRGHRVAPGIAGGPGCALEARQRCWGPRVPWEWARAPRRAASGIGSPERGWGRPRKWGLAPRCLWKVPADRGGDSSRTWWVLWAPDVDLVTLPGGSTEMGTLGGEFG